MTSVHAAEAASKSRVVKKLHRLQPGTLRWARRYGEALLCVRYRLADDGTRRFTTVELLVDEAPTRRASTAEPVGVRIGIGEVALRAQIKAAGGRWDPASKVWRMARGQARALRVEDRVVEG